MTLHQAGQALEERPLLGQERLDGLRPAARTRCQRPRDAGRAFVRFGHDPQALPRGRRTTSFAAQMLSRSGEPTTGASPSSTAESLVLTHERSHRFRQLVEELIHIAQILVLAEPRDRELLLLDFERCHGARAGAGAVGVVGDPSWG